MSHLRIDLAQDKPRNGSRHYHNRARTSRSRNHRQRNRSTHHWSTNRERRIVARRPALADSGRQGGRASPSRTEPSPQGLSLIDDCLLDIAGQTQWCWILWCDRFQVSPFLCQPSHREPGEVSPISRLFSPHSLPRTVGLWARSSTTRVFLRIHVELPVHRELGRHHDPSSARRLDPHNEPHSWRREIARGSVSMNDWLVDTGRSVSRKSLAMV